MSPRRWVFRGTPADAARASAHKRLARERLARAGLPAPRYVAATVDADPIEVSRRARYPAVVKPVSLSGSRGVIRVDTPEALVAAFGRVSALLSRPEIRALRTGSEHEILVEDFIAGREYAVEGLMSRGRVHVVSPSSTSPIRSTVRSSKRRST